jgi:hypothetical protein
MAGNGAADKVLVVVISIAREPIVDEESQADKPTDLDPKFINSLLPLIDL